MTFFHIPPENSIKLSIFPIAINVLTLELNVYCIYTVFNANFDNIVTVIIERCPQ